MKWNQHTQIMYTSAHFFWKMSVLGHFGVNVFMRVHIWVIFCGVGKVGVTGPAYSPAPSTVQWHQTYWNKDCGPLKMPS